MHLLIHPHPAAPESGWAWVAEEHPPTWTHTLTRALHLAMTQSIYDDLRRMDKTNSRLRWRDGLVAAIATWAEDARRTDPAAYEELTNRLSLLLTSIDSEKAGLRAQANRPAGPADLTAAPGTDGGLSELLTEVVDRVAGLADKQPVVVEVVSPTLVAGGQPVEQLLAGEFLAHFGGFLRADLRLSDFVLGYRSMQKWMERGWEHNGLNPRHAEAMRVAAAARFEDGWKKYPIGTETFRSLGWRGRISLGRMALHVGHVVEHDLTHPDKQRG